MSTNEVQSELAAVPAAAAPPVAPVAAAPVEAAPPVAVQSAPVVSQESTFVVPAAPVFSKAPPSQVEQISAATSAPAQAGAADAPRKKAPPIGVTLGERAVATQTGLVPMDGKDQTPDPFGLRK